MYVIGKVVAIDILLNNPDRIPSIWPNAGNPRNFMIESQVQVTKANLHEGKNAEEVFLNSRATASLSVTNIVPIDNNSIPIDTSRPF